MQEITNVKLSWIVSDTHQPRKFFNADAMEDLKKSIIADGVLQPILLRPIGDGNYKLVFGERRYKASLLVMEEYPDRNTIPAMIRELTDDEARNMQLEENLHRENMHPMEEAVAFQEMVLTSQSIDNIAARIGKSTVFVRQRLKLTDLVDDWQKKFYENKISITQAVKIASYPKEVQYSLLKEIHTNADGIISISKWSFEKYQGILDDAIFPLEFDFRDHPELSKMGACTKCQFNSANSLLFPDQSQERRCERISCFKDKTKEWQAIGLKMMLEDPTVVYLSTKWSKVDTNELVDAVEKAGHKVYTTKDYDQVNPPEPLETYSEFEKEWLDENYEIDGDGNRSTDYEELKNNWLQRQEEHQQELKDYAEEIVSPGVVKGFVVDGYNQGATVFVYLRDNATGTTSTKESFDKDIVKAVVSGKLSEEVKIDDQVKIIKNEIQRLKDREVRAKELDTQKIWTLLHRHFNPFSNAEFLKGPLNTIERKALSYCLIDKLSFNKKQDVWKLLKMKKLDDLGTITDEQLNQLMRYFLLDILPPSAIMQPGEHERYKLSMEVGRNYFPGVITEAETNQQAVVDKRTAKLNEKIDALTAKIKELRKEMKKAAAPEKSTKSKKKTAAAAEE